MKILEIRKWCSAREFGPALICPQNRMSRRPRGGSTGPFEGSESAYDSPVPAVVGSLFLKDLWEVRENLIDACFRKLALAEGVIGLHHVARIQHDRDVGIL